MDVDAVVAEQDRAITASEVSQITGGELREKLREARKGSVAL